MRKNAGEHTPGVTFPCGVKILLKMKLTMCIFLLTISGAIASEAYSQTAKLSLDLKNITVKEALGTIEDQSEFFFLYSEKMIDVNRKVNIEVRSSTIEKILDQIFEGSNVSYTVKDRQIVLTTPEANWLSGTSQGEQQKSVSGKVTDSSGGALPGVTVVVKGTTNGTITNANGNYSLSNIPANAILQFSFVGMKTQDIAVGNKTTINVTLAEETVGIEEIVAIGYGTQKKISVTGAIVSVGTKSLVASPNASVANTLAGRVTGLTSVQYSGQPGGDDPLIYIRGLGSLTSAASAPLILVDGVERSFTQLDPNEIESVSVLKDASATAVFGVRGANGVVIVTTKRGVIGTPKISFSASSGLQKPLRLPSFEDSYHHALLYTEAQLNDDPNAVLRFSPTAIEAFRTNSDPVIYPNMDWMDYILKPAAFQTQENLNISGGDKTVKYFVSVGYMKQDGLFRTFDLSNDFNYGYNRYNYRANLDIDVTKTTKISLTTGGRNEVRNELIQAEPQFSIWRNIYFALPYRGIGIVDGKHIMSDIKYIPGETRDALNGYYGLGYQNAIRNILNFDINVKQQLDFLTKGLSFRIKGSYNSIYNHIKSRNSSEATYMANYLHDLDPTAPDDKTIVYKKNGEDGIMGFSESFGKARDWYFESAFSYDRDFGIHHVTGLLLYNESKSFYPAVNPDIPLGYVGLAGRITYDYKSKYLFDLNMGYNGSENFAPGKRFGLFPAISMGWVLTAENFMKKIPVIEYLKLRGSYGIVGNDRMGGRRFLYLPDSYLASSGGYSFGTDVPQNQVAAAEGNIGNPMVTWEKSRKQDFGLDLKMMKGKFGVVADYFFEHRDNILTTRQTVPGIVALNLPVVNIGVVDNHGYELELKWRDKIGGFGYLISPNLSFARNKIIFMDEVSPAEPYLLRTGNRVNQPFGYVFDGFWSEKDVTHLSDFPNPNYSPKPGDLRYKDLNGDGVINVDDQRPIGYPDYPEYVFGLTVELNYKNFDLHMLWSGATNVSRALEGSFNRPFGPNMNFGLMKYMADGRWTPETAATATYPRLTFLGVENNVKVSDFWVRDASYIRLKNVELGYNFNVAHTRFIKRLGITGLRVYANGYNLLTFDKLKIIDPESKPSAGDPQYPLMGIYNLGVNVTF